MARDPLHVQHARAAGVRDPAVLAALAQIDRRDFVPPQRRDAADRDAPVALEHGQTTSQPSLQARMVELLELRGDERVLEVGAGYGFQTALLAKLAAEVVAVERLGSLAEAAAANLRTAGIANATVVHADAYDLAGVPDERPFDAVVLGAAFDEVPDAVVAATRVGARLVAPLRRAGGETLVRHRRTAEGLDDGEQVAAVRFVPARRGLG